MKTTANQRCNRNIPATANQWCNRNIIPAGFTLHHSPSEFPRWCNNTMISIPIHPKHHKTHTYRITHVHKCTCRILGAHTHILTGSWVHTHTFSQDPGCTHTHSHRILGANTHILTGSWVHTHTFSQDPGCINILTVHGRIHTHKHSHRITNIFAGSWVHTHPHTSIRIVVSK